MEVRTVRVQVRVVIRPRVRDAGVHADDVHRAENHLQPFVQLPPEPVLPCTPVDVDRGLYTPVVGRALVQTSDIGIANDVFGGPVCLGNFTGTGRRRRRKRSAIHMRGACIGLLLLHHDDVRIGRQRVRDPRAERLDARHLILEGDRRLLDIRRINRQQRLRILRTRHTKCQFSHAVSSPRFPGVYPHKLAAHGRTVFKTASLNLMGSAPMNSPHMGERFSRPPRYERLQCLYIVIWHLFSARASLPGRPSGSRGQRNPP